MSALSHFSWLEHDQLSQLHAGKTDAIKRGLRVFDLSMINPDLPPARSLLDRLLEATNRPANHRYAVARGIRKLREAFAIKYSSKFRSNLDPETEVCVTMGAKDALTNLLWCLSQAGDRIIVGKPTYPAFLAALKLARVEPIFFEIDRYEDRMVSQIATLIKEHKPNGLLLNFPNNPTGISVSSEFYRDLIAVTSGEDLFVINDFVYGELGWEESKPASLFSVDQARHNMVEIYSMSKAYNIPGWRVAAVVGAPQICHLLARLKAHVDYGLFLPLQLAAAGALVSQYDLAATVADHYQERAKVVAQGLKRLGWEIHEPSAGASIWAKLPYNLKKLNSIDFCCGLVRQCGICLLPGELFGPDYQSYVRVALVLPEEDLRQVITQIAGYHESFLALR